jgi:hypothetical protein
MADEFFVPLHGSIMYASDASLGYTFIRIDFETGGVLIIPSHNELFPAFKRYCDRMKIFMDAMEEEKKHGR